LQGGLLNVRDKQLVPELLTINPRWRKRVCEAGESIVFNTFNQGRYNA